MLTLSRLAWLNTKIAQWELWELDQATEELQQRDAADHGNLATRLLHAPNEAAARERFSESAARVMTLVPDAMREVVEQRIRRGTELASLLHGLEFARIRMGIQVILIILPRRLRLGRGPDETPLSDGNESELRELVARLFASNT